MFLELSIWQCDQMWQFVAILVIFPIGDNFFTKNWKKLATFMAIFRNAKNFIVDNVKQWRLALDVYIFALEMAFDIDIWNLLINFDADILG